MPMCSSVCDVWVARSLIRSRRYCGRGENRILVKKLNAKAFQGLNLDVDELEHGTVS